MLWLLENFGGPIFMVIILLLMLVVAYILICRVISAIELFADSANIKATAYARMIDYKINRDIKRRRGHEYYADSYNGDEHMADRD